ncbi:MAG: SDR family oxidoreductase [Pirellulaceae bacterium]
MSKYTLLTGATGLVGRYLVRDLLMAGNRLALVVRPSQKQDVAERVESILQMWEGELGKPLNRPVCLEGDVSEERMALSDASRSWIAENCDRVLHNAAVLTFHGVDREREPWRTNVGGTRNVLELCRQLQLKDLHYVSTAYVCGLRDGKVMEDELDEGQGFRNDYEHSKFLAEQLVREADFLDKLTVYRPAVISGDSVTGYTNTYHGLYLYLRLISLIVPLMPVNDQGIRIANLRLNMKGTEPRNVVPVDWISKVMCRLLNTPAAHGATYHLAPREPITARAVIDFACEYYNTTDVFYCGDNPIAEEDMTDFERDVHAGMSMYESYVTTDPRFDTTNLRKFAADLPCPEIDHEMLLRYIRFCEQDRWGKKKSPKVRIPVNVSDYLTLLSGGKCADEQSSKQDDVQTVGLDVLGPGGGQWTLNLRGGDLVGFELGLPRAPQPILRLTAEEFVSLTSAATGPRNFGRQLQLNGQNVNGELADSLRNALFSKTSADLLALAATDPRDAPLHAEARASSSD